MQAPKSACLPESGALVARLTLGVVALAHGLLLKVMTFGLAGTVGFFESLGLPGFLAYLVTFGEIAAGVALILGVLSRWAAIGLLPIMLGAIWVHAGNGWGFSAAGGGWEYPAVLAALSLVVALLGDGCWSGGRLLARWFGK